MYLLQNNIPLDEDDRIRRRSS